MKNAIVRTVSAVVFAAVMVCAIILLPQILPAVVIIAIYLMMGEFYGMSMGNCYRLQQKLFILSAEILFATFFCVSQFGISLKWMLLASLPMLAAMTALLFDDDREFVFKFPYLFAGLLYIGIPTALLPIVVFRQGEYYGWTLMCFFLIIWASDVGAYCLGSALGQKPGSRKLAPSISPKKSWWGVVGGAAFAVGAAILTQCIGWFDVPPVHAVVIGLLICAAGICGDLFESVWKRYFHIKDSGNVIPGHGGMLDRFDSSLFAIPAATVYLAMFNLL